MIIADYTLDHMILRETLEQAPSSTVTWEESHTGPDDQQQFIAWVESDNFDAFDRGLGADASVANPEVLTEPAGRRLYRFDLTGDAAETDIMPLLMEVGGVHRDLIATSDGWRNRTQFPDRQALERIYRFCRKNNIPFTFHRIWEQVDRYGDGQTKLTPAQRDVLRAAIEHGYLDIPRRCSLAELGATLDISESAASERFRRATSNLIKQTLA